jgi:hypothetical protein
VALADGKRAGEGKTRIPIGAGGRPTNEESHVDQFEGA